jgi:hypothetical protein
MPYQIDESLNPIVIVHFNASLTVETATRLFSEVDDLLTRLGTFGLVMQVNYQGGEQERGVTKMQKQWLSANRPRFKKDCVGIAMVSSDAKYVSFYAPLANKIISRMYHCPGAMFGNADKALAWVQARLPQPVGL